MKVAIPGETQFFYPDILITKEAETDQNRYVQYQPELIAEVLSGTTRAKDTIDKFMQYRKIPTLEYYLLVEPEKLLVICYSPYSAASCKSWLTRGQKIKNLNRILKIINQWFSTLKKNVSQNFRTESNEWDMASYTRIEETISLPKLAVTLPLQKIYTSL